MRRECNLKKLLICLALLCIFPLIFSACFSKRNGGSDDPGDFADHGGTPMEFQHFSLSESGMSAQSYVYEGYKTETGVHLEHFIRSEYWDNTVSGNVSRHYRKSPMCERV